MSQTAQKGDLVASLIPHSREMMLLDRLIDFDDESLLVSARLEALKIFANEQVPAYSGLELMAQTVAAWSGIQARKQGGKPRLGLLLGTRKCQMFTENFSTDLLIRATLVFQDEQVGSFQCQVLSAVDQSELVKARLTVFQPPNAVEYLKSK